MKFTFKEYRRTINVHGRVFHGSKRDPRKEDEDHAGR